MGVELGSVASYLHKVGLLEAARGHGGGADAHAAGRHGGDVAVHGVLVERDVRHLEDLLHLVGVRVKG